ncbi:hypothetical protein DFZ84_19390 [Escherichia coli]|nr:hypothetical protein [Escherichia coli]
MKQISLFIPLLGTLLLSGCAGTSTEFECNATTSDTPCAAEAFKEAIKSDTSDYQPEPLSLGKAKKLASACRERNEMAEVKRVRENERNKIREKQLQALNDAHSAKEH